MNATKELRAGNANDAVPSQEEVRKIDVKAAIKRLVSSYGANLLNRADLDDILADEGLSRSDATSKAVCAADNEVRSELVAAIKEPPSRLKFEWKLERKADEGSFGPIWNWMALGGLYRVARLLGPYARYAATMRLSDAKAAKEREIVNDKRTLNSCMEAVERFHKELNEISKMDSNRESVVQKAVDAGLAKLALPEEAQEAQVTQSRPSVASDSITTTNSIKDAGDEEMTAMVKAEPKVRKLTEDAARKLMVALGYGNATNVEMWPFDKLAERIHNKYSEGVAEQDAPEDGQQAKMHKRMEKLYKGGGRVEVVAGAAATNGQAANGNGESVVETPKRRGRPAGSKNKVHSERGGEMGVREATEAPKRRGRPVGSKNKAHQDGGGKMSALDAAAKVLAASNKPLNAKDLIEKMTAKGYWTSPGGKTPHCTLAAAIYTEINKRGSESRFVKAERGLFTVK